MGAAQRLVRDHRPTFPDVEKLIDGWIEAEFSAFGVVELQGSLARESVRGHFPRRCEKVSVEIARIAAGEIPWRMNRNIHGESITVRQLL